MSNIHSCISKWSLSSPINAKILYQSVHHFTGIFTPGYLTNNNDGFDWASVCQNSGKPMLYDRQITLSSIIATSTKSGADQIKANSKQITCHSKGLEVKTNAHLWFQEIIIDKINLWKTCLYGRAFFRPLNYHQLKCKMDFLWRHLPLNLSCIFAGNKLIFSLFLRKLILKNH